MTEPAPFDPGLQPERTLLAWRRTCLALAVASAVIIRFAGEAIGVAAIILGAAGILAAGIAYVRSATRYRRAHDALTRGEDLPLDGLALALLTTTLVLIGVSALAYVVVIGAGRVAG